MKKYFFILISSIFLNQGFAQQKSKPDLKLVFYNVENFYDWQNDPKVNDEEFLPESQRRWTKYRFEDKAMKLFKVFAAIGESDFPDIIGMAEVENLFVLKYLVSQTPMQKVSMGIVHKESTDPRGIDACILYRMDKLTLLNSEFISLRQKNGQIQQTRDIVYASFRTQQKDVVHIFVNHWPSRRGGELETQQKRNNSAYVLRQKVDSIFKTNPGARIVITGDFNDEPYNASITKTLKVLSPDGPVSASGLYNLSGKFVKTYGTGTLKFKGNWSVFDQIIVSGALLGKQGLTSCTLCAGVFNKQFLLNEDKTHMGYTPWRTYNGLNYSGGYSDHLPVYLDLYYKM